MDELKEKHRKGTNEVDDPDRAPTGEAYQALYQQQQAAARDAAQRRKQQEQETKAAEERQREALRQQMRHFGNDENDDKDGNDDSDYDYLLEEDDDDDPVLEAIRKRRMEELRHEQIRKAEDIARGHGQYRTITQDEFLPECTGSSKYVAVHFFHKEFQRCEIMDHHLKLIAPVHTTCKFLRIDAEKAPFFVSKLQVRTLPTLIVFREGKAIDRLTGFEGLAVDSNDPDKWETSRLQEWMASTGAIKYTKPTAELRGEMERLGLRPKLSMYSGGVDRYDED